MATLKFLSRKDMKNIESLGSVIAYSVKREKTKYQNTNLVSGIGCMPETALKDFQATKKLFGKEDGVQFYYAIQSFPSDANIDAYTAHQMALELAEKCYPDYQVLVATHTDTDNIHSHIIINSVRSTDGKKIHQCKKDIERMREINDEICIKYNSPICKPKKDNVKPMTGAEYFSAISGESWKLDLTVAISTAMKTAKSKTDFISILEEKGYKVDWADNHKYITYTTPTGKKCRDNKLHYQKYRKENMEYEFKTREIITAAINGYDYEELGKSCKGYPIGNADSRELGQSYSYNQESNINNCRNPFGYGADSNEDGFGRLYDRQSQQAKGNIQPSFRNIKQLVINYGKSTEELSRQLGIYLDRCEGSGWENERKLFIKSIFNDGKVAEDIQEASYNPLHSNRTVNNISDNGIRFAGNLLDLINNSGVHHRRKRIRLCSKTIEKKRAHGLRTDGDEEYSVDEGWEQSM
ncbi:MAG: relaxase/mobilization nuclease domain-containing protein [Eubacterium sp.]